LSDEENALRDMMQMLEQETKIATKSKLNADYVPGMVTVLYGKELEAMGFELVWEALSMVPGIANIRNSVGEFGNSFRGVGPVLGGGKILYMINGRHVETQLRGSGPAFSLPLDRVDRIEVIRGPGSSIYGGYAYSGVVNVVLKKGSGLSLRSTNQRYRSGGVRVDSGKLDNGIRTWIQGSAATFSGSKTMAGRDLMYQLGNGANSNAPGQVNDKVDYTGVGMGLEWKGFEFWFNFNRSNSQDIFGLNNTLSPKSNPGYFIFRYNDYYLDKTVELDDQELLFRIGRQELKYYGNTSVLPPGFTTLATLPVVGATVVSYPDGMRQQQYYSEQKHSAEMEWHLNKFADHQLLLALSAGHTGTGNPWYKTNYELATTLPFNATNFIMTGKQTPIGWLNNHTGVNNWIKEGIQRNEQAAVLQDEWQITDSFTLTSGVRYDHFSDVGSRFSPRIAGVYALSEKHIFKSQFATAFRPPTFLELYLSPSVGVHRGNINLNPETSNNMDMSYIYKDATLTLRTSLFYSKMNNLISVDVNKTYENIGRANRKGVEFEYKGLPLHNLRLEGNISYTVARDEITNRDLVSSSRLLSNTQVVYSPTNDLRLFVLSQYIGKRARAAQDPRSAAPSTTLWNASVQYSDFIVEGLSATLGIRNMFDKAQVYPSPMVVHPATGNLTYSYRNDYPQNGRRGWLQFNYAL